ncbi:MAG: ribosomal protein [Firmicutes bacterium]|jgi:large subunit ribosomal protein L32|nr:ribosomal protein [Bacillota bacterium]
MAVPKKKMSKARRDSRRANWRLVAPNLSICPNCKAPTMPHRVCPTCGQYQGRQIVNMESEAAAE